MTVRTKFLWLFLLGTIVLLSLGAYLYDYNQRLESELERNEIIHSIGDGVVELSILSNEFQTRREDRVRQQWDGRHASLTNLLLVADQKFTELADRLLIDRLRAEQAALRAVFFRISSTSQVEQLAAVGQDEWIGRLNSEMSQGILDMVGIEERLLANSLASMISVQRRVNLLAATWALTLAAFGIATGVIARNLLRSVRSLTDGTREFGRGNLDHRIRSAGRDELGRLASAFNQMADSRSKSETMLAESLQELGRSQELLSITLSSIGDAVIAADQEGRVSFLNPVASALIGWNIEEAMGKPVREVFEIVNEETLEPAEDPVRKVLREKRVVGLANHTLLISKDGTRRPIADSGAPITGQEGNVFGVVLVFR
ncbi:MAG: HAMP domain-containing protein, partial [Acidobacteriota bacterium]